MPLLTEVVSSDNLRTSFIMYNIRMRFNSLIKDSFITHTVKSNVISILQKRKAFSSMVQHGPRALILCGPSGSGKSSLLRKLFEEFPDRFGFSVSHTTRSPRPGEVDGVHYHFTTKDDMKEAIARGEFLESAEFSGNIYGTSKAAVEEVARAGKVCVLDIDMQGVKQVKQTDLAPLYVFVKPPSIDELEKRLRGRNTETEESLQRRLAAAKRELEYGETPGNFDLVIVNDCLEKAYARLKEFILAELEKQNSSAVNGN